VFAVHESVWITGVPTPFIYNIWRFGVSGQLQFSNF